MLVVGSMPDGFSANCNLVSVATDAGAILEQMVGAASSDHSTAGSRNMRRRSKSDCVRIVAPPAVNELARRRNLCESTQPMDIPLRAMQSSILITVCPSATALTSVH